MQTLFEQRAMELQNEANRVIIDKLNEISLRDYFAAQAMIAISDWDCIRDTTDLANIAYMAADKMLEKRKENK